MAGYNVRSLAELGAQARKFFVQAIDGAIASVWANTFTVIGKVLALLGFEQELRRRWLFKQVFASTADDLWLARHGFELNMTRNPGLPAVGLVAVPCGSGERVPSGLQFGRQDGTTYTSAVPATAVNGSVELYLQADVRGDAGNIPAGSVLTLIADGSAPDSLGTDAVVKADGLNGGSDGEALEDFRARVLARKRNPPQGGAALDYVRWVKEAIPNVRDVFVDSFSNDERSVWVQFTVTDQLDFIPVQQQVDSAQAYVDDPVRRPVTARVFVTAPNPVPVNITIAGLTFDSAATRGSIAIEIAAEFIDRARPGTPSGPFVLSKSWIDEAISRAIGEDRHSLAAPAGDLTFTAGQYPVLGDIGYTD